MRKSILWFAVGFMVMAGVSACGGSDDPAPLFSIAGTVTSSGTGLQGVTMTLSNSATTTTDGSGNYTFTGLSNGAYTVTPSLHGFTFDPVNSAQTVNGADITEVNFVVASFVHDH